MHNNSYRKNALRVIASTIAFVLLAYPHHIVRGADKANELRTQINSATTEIDQINQEIERLGSELKKTEAEKQTLASRISEIDYTRQIIANDIKATETKVTRTELTIEELDLAIGDNLTKADKHRSQIAASLRAVREDNTSSLLELFLRGSRLSTAWENLNNLQQLQLSLGKAVSELNTTNETLINQIAQKRSEIEELDRLRGALADKKSIADNNRKKQASLLSATKQQESEYQKLLAEQVKRKEEFESELLRLEQELSFVLDPSSLPSEGSLSWPLDGQITVTQHFGNTSFSQRHSGVYNGNGHRGIDLRAAVGTPLKSAASGVVIGTGDTDLTCKGASYGRWVLIQHGNGLTTLYAHMDLIKVREGQNVERGELIGYTGDTGYVTGPHLHFTVFASGAVTVKQLPSKNRSCGIYTLPVSPLNGYLSPLEYLP